MKIIKGVEIPTRQSLPPDDYIVLIGTAITVFNANNSFVIEKILKINSTNYNWYQLIDNTSGQLKEPVKLTIAKVGSNDIKDLFNKLVDMRNRIMHSFQATLENSNEQILRTKEPVVNKQYDITREYLNDFIKLNQKLSDKLYKLNL